MTEKKIKTLEKEFIRKQLIEATVDRWGYARAFALRGIYHPETTVHRYLNHPSYEYARPLMLAVHNQDLEFVEYLLSQGAQTVYLGDGGFQGFCVMDLQSLRRNSYVSPEQMAAFQSGANPSLSVPLSRDYEITEALLRAGADPFCARELEVGGAAGAGGDSTQAFPLVKALVNRNFMPALAMVAHDPNFVAMDILKYSFLDMKTTVASRSVAWWSALAKKDSRESEDKLFYEQIAPLALRKLQQAKAGSYLTRQLFMAEERGELSLDAEVITASPDWWEANRTPAVTKEALSKEADWD